MNEAQNRNMGRKRKQGNKTPQKANYHTIEDLVENEGRNPQLPRSEK
jgi:hypothetical protein